jgi:hypothetical protein
MVANMTNSRRREVDPVQRVLRIIGGIALGLALGFVVVVFIELNVIGLAFYQDGRAHSPRPLTGWQDAAVTLLGVVSFPLALLLWALLPIALALGTACIESDPVAERGLRHWAAVVGIVTGVLLVLDVLPVAVAGKLTHFI